MSLKLVIYYPSVYCAELIMRRPWFVGGSDLDILGKIFQALGTPTEAQWPGMKDLPNFVEFQKTAPPPLASVVKGVRTSVCHLSGDPLNSGFFNSTQC